MKTLLAKLSLAFATAQASLGGLYIQTADVHSAAFFDAFVWQAIADPTHARVNLTDQATARALNLSFVSPAGTFVMRMDDTSVLDPAGPGRNSVRIMSNANYTTHVAIFDIKHMPEGCGTWPTIIEVAQDGLLANGKADIVEGVNNNGTDQATLHTMAGCTVAPQSALTSSGLTVSTNCDDVATNGGGCNVRAPTSTRNFGPAFNENGGGWYAFERMNASLKVWFWERHDLRVPLDVEFGVGLVDTGLWGKPFALWTNETCDISTHFGPNNVVFKNNICGDWAGVDYNADGCPGVCNDDANTKPEMWSRAFWEINAMRIYEQPN